MVQNGVLPEYTIKGYTEHTYGIIKFHRRGLSLSTKEKSEQKSYDEKLLNSFSRARSMVKQYALCNPWKWFFTGTINPEWYDRKNLDCFYKELSQWIRDKRKAYGLTLQYLLVPEKHKDGSWHLHGMLEGIPEYALYRFKQYNMPEWFQEQGVSHLFPNDLVENEFYDWWDYSERFGFCSLAPICNPVGTALYLTKYVSKDMVGRSSEIGKHLYYVSRPLKTAVDVMDIYSPCLELETYLTYHGEFCSTGMVFGKEWHWPFNYEGYMPEFKDNFVSLDAETDFEPAQIEPEYEQVWVEGYR